MAEEKRTYRKGELLAALEDFESALPFICDDPSDWTSLDVDYDKPRVERLWRSVKHPKHGSLRLYLHRIHPCGTPLYHPHPWPSAVKIIQASGVYEMGVGTSRDSSDPAETVMVLRLPEGSSYEMTEPNGWHWVNPVTSPVLTLMVTAEPWTYQHPGLKKPTEKLEPLAQSTAAVLLAMFREACFTRSR